MITAIALQDRISKYKNRRKRTFAFFVFLAFAAVITALSLSSIAVSVQPAAAAFLESTSTTAKRLERRLALGGEVDLSLAMEERKVLLNHRTTVTFAVTPESPLATLDVSLADHPSWIVFEKGKDGQMHAVVSASRVTADLGAAPIKGLHESVSCEVLSTWKDKADVTRAQTSCIAKAGYKVDADAIGLAVKSALESTAEDNALVTVTSVPAVIRDADYAPYDTFTLLATGHSGFKGSGDGRKSNVRKALNERMHNVLVPAGEVFSYNDALGNAGSLKDGWKMALTIFEGVNLRPAPGGGVCQVSTTIFRAALRAGLPIVEQKNHSLFVSYYTAFGVGQDATVYPGKQDFRFRNDTGHPIILQAYHEGDEAFVNIYGIDDGRAVTVKGPYFANNAPEEVTEQGKKIRGNEIGWVRSVQSATGESTDDLFIARYKAIPKSLSKSHAATVEQTRVGVMHAAPMEGEEVAVRVP